MPCSAWTLARVSAPGSLAQICAASSPLARRPPIRLAAMLPAPIKAIRVLLMTGPYREVSQPRSGLAVIAGAKQCGTDPYPCGALGDGRFQIVAHAHGK